MRQLEVKDFLQPCPAVSEYFRVIQVTTRKFINAKSRSKKTRQFDEAHRLSEELQQILQQTERLYRLDLDPLIKKTLDHYDLTKILRDFALNPTNKNYIVQGSKILYPLVKGTIENFALFLGMEQTVKFNIDDVYDCAKTNEGADFFAEELRTVHSSTNAFLKSIEYVRPILLKPTDPPHLPITISGVLRKMNIDYHIHALSSQDASPLQRVNSLCAIMSMICIRLRDILVREHVAEEPIRSSPGLVSLEEQRGLLTNIDGWQGYVHFFNFMEKKIGSLRDECQTIAMDARRIS